MIPDKYALRKTDLQFRDASTESDYREYILDRTRVFSRITWALVIVLGGPFGALDQQVFGENGTLVTVVRLGLLAFAAAFLAVTFKESMRKFLVWSSPLFILSTGLFCIFLVAMSDRSMFTPYFTGLFFAFAGIFSTAGLGFRYSLAALLSNLVVFEVAIGILAPVPPELFTIYTFFLCGSVLVFAFCGYFIERLSRENFIVSARLRDSLAEVRTLSGLLPICAHCKKIRDDKGYWSQLESYLSMHSDVQLSHGICPECLIEHYPELKVTLPGRSTPSSD